MGQSSKRRRRRRKFNGPRGRHSLSRKRQYKKQADKIQTTLKQRLLNIKGKPKPFQLRRIIHIGTDGRRCVKISVKRLPQHELRCLTTSSPLHISCHTTTLPPVQGYRLMNLSNFSQHLNTTTEHAISCTAAISAIKKGQQAFQLVSEVRQAGLISTLVALCCCGKKFYFDTSSRDTSESIPHFDVNFRAVWGTMSTGSGLSKMTEFLGTIGVPGIPHGRYTNIERTIRKLWASSLQEDIIATGLEERKLAIERGDFHQGVPAITVVCDGGWSKRSHRHTYDALGGVAVIFGAATGKLLHIGVRNRHCHTCTISETNNKDPVPHECFKNWEESSQAMEADVICEGFLEAESKHGVRYMRMIADGDSSVFTRIQQAIPVWGKDVEKLGCANHSCKCLRSSLEKLVSEKPHYKGKGKLTKQIRIRLATAVRCAIRMRSAERNKSDATKQLAKDIRNAVYHVFGDHRQCSDFCRASQVAATPDCVNDDVEEQPDEFLKDQETYWKDGTSEKDMEESRGDVSYETSLDKDIIRDVSVLLDRLANKSTRLIGNFTTNLAESWMAIRMKFDGGKVINRCKSGSWHYRCYGGGLRKNFGPAWSPIVFQRCTSTKPGSIFTTLFRRRSQHLLRSLKSQNKMEVKGRSRKRKLKSLSIAASKKAKKAYGKDVTDVVEDVSSSTLQGKCDAFLKDYVNHSNEHCEKIQYLTKSQSLCNLWREERRVRLTSMCFGEIVHKRVKGPVAPLVHRLLYNKFLGNRYTSYGLSQESVTIKEYVQFKADHGDTVHVEILGLTIDQDHKYLAASTDGVVVYNDGREKGLLEIKNLLQKNQMTLQEAAKKMPGFCLNVTGSGLKLRRNHKFYFQCQGQMNVIGFPWLDFVVRRTNPNQLHVERITRDQNLWLNTMVLKLTAFYFQALLPELAVPRRGLSPGIREPEKPWFIPTPVSVVKQSASQNTSTHWKQKLPEKPSDKPLPGCSSDNLAPSTRQRSQRRRLVKFVGRKIKHEWCVDEESGKTEWYTGMVLDCVKGKDGEEKASYEIKYEGETDTFVVENLSQDFTSGCVKFIDL